LGRDRKKVPKAPPADDDKARMLAADPTAAAIREAYAREQAAKAVSKPTVKKQRV